MLFPANNLLAIVNDILDSNKIESEEGKGSNFYFTQTFEKCIQTPEQQEDKILPPTEDNNLLSGIRILLVEDNPINVLVAQKFLEHRGAKIETASNGPEALNLIDPEKHDLVLIDLHMPVMVNDVVVKPFLPDELYRKALHYVSRKI